MRARSNAADSSLWRHLVVASRRDLSLDFVNTLGWRGSAREESLNNLSDLLKWLVSVGTISVPAATALQKWLEARPALAASVFADAITLRETLYRLLRSIATGSSPPADDLDHFNGVLAEAPPRAVLDQAESGFGWRIDAKPTVASLLTTVLWSAADILVASQSARLRECANDRCLWLFFDDSKNGSRRWCSMQSCGNRAKAHRHYLHQRKR
jgi:predicted RNA-binding Zn ribbon-like protein